MKFGDLSNFISKDYVFDVDKFMSFDGKTGPYIQYTIARINSILSKATDNFEKEDIAVESDMERDIIMAILRLNSSYKVSYDDYSLNLICSSTFDLAKAFSTNFAAKALSSDTAAVCGTQENL